jgi:predicted RNase H-like HicB family nuclease
MKVRAYLVIIEPTATGFGAYVPDLPGLAIFGETRELLVQNLREGIAFHLEGLVYDGMPIPEPISEAISIIA